MNILITGANRGIGLGLTQKYLSLGHAVWMGCRNPDGARELWELERDFGNRAKILKLDVADPSDIAGLQNKLGDQSIDLLINNAGVLPPDSRDLANVSLVGMTKAFAVNSIAPALVCRAVLENLKKSQQPKVIHLSSKMGSIADNSSGAYYAYRMSKAALNMFNKSFAIDHPQLTSIVIHPGWVQTDMGGAQAPTSIEESVEGIVDVVSGLKKDQSGRFYDYQGNEIPW